MAIFKGQNVEMRRISLSQPDDFTYNLVTRLRSVVAGMAQPGSVEELFSQLNGIINAENPNNDEALGVINQSQPPLILTT